MTDIKCQFVRPDDTETIELIAGWYFDEWAIPRERTISRLKNHPNEDILFQVILKQGNNPIATGGLYNNVGILQVHPKYKELSPWVALLYTSREYRNNGFGTKLLEEIKEAARERQISTLYLYTFTAEILYIRNGWTVMERVDYRGQDTVVMKKEI